MKVIKQDNVFKPIILEIETRVELAILLAAIAQSNNSKMNNYIHDHHAEDMKIDTQKNTDHAVDIFDSLNELFIQTKGQS